jgi:hypothetical protein
MNTLTIPLPNDCEAIAVAGGPYSNFAAVAAFLGATRALEHRFCLGDIGGFGPLPDRTIALIQGAGLACLPEQENAERLSPQPDLVCAVPN